MGRTATVTNMLGYRCLLVLANIGSIVYRNDDTAIITAGASEIVVHKSVAESLEELISL